MYKVIQYDIVSICTLSVNYIVYPSLRKNHPAPVCTWKKSSIAFYVLDYSLLVVYFNKKWSHIKKNTNSPHSPSLFLHIINIICLLLYYRICYLQFILFHAYDLGWWYHIFALKCKKYTYYLVVVVFSLNET